MKGTRRKSVASRLAELRGEEKRRVADLHKEFRAKREMALLADEVGRRLVKAGVFTPEDWDRASREMVTDCGPEFEVDAWNLEGDRCVPRRTADGAPVLLAMSRALNCKLSKDYVGSPTTRDLGRTWACVTVWLNLAGALDREADDGLAERLEKARVRCYYKLYRLLPDDGSPVVLGRSMTNGKLVECKVVKKQHTSEYVTIQCERVE